MKRNHCLLFLFAILLIGIVLRSWNLETIPHWFWDEGVNMHISWNLANGRMQWFCLKYAFAPHPPLYFLIASFLLESFGNELIVLRGLSVIYSILTILLVYLIGSKMFGERIGLLSSLLLAIYPTAVYWNRMAFANNQVMFLSMLSLYSILLYLDQRDNKWFYLTGVLAGLSMVTEILGVGVFFAIAAILWIYDRRRLPMFIIVSAIPPLVFVVYMLNLMPEYFIGDVLHGSGRANYNALALSLSIIAFMVYPSKIKEVAGDFIQWVFEPVILEIRENLPIFYLALSLIVFLMPPSDDIFVLNLDFFWFGVAGFYFIKEKGNRDILLAFFLSTFVMLLWLNRSDHMIIPLYPLFCIGLSLLLTEMYGISCLYFREKVKRNAALIALVLVFYPLAVTLYYDVSSFITGDALSVEDIGAREQVADFVNAQVTAEDVVLCDSHLTRMINCKTSVLIQSASFEGKPIAYIRGDYGRDRFLFNCSYRNARFVVLVNGTMEWAMNQTALVDSMNEVQNWSYDVVDNYFIYKNPML